MTIGDQVVIKRDQSDKQEWTWVPGIIVDRTVSSSGDVSWHVLVGGSVMRVEPWQLGLLESCRHMLYRPWAGEIP